MGKKDKPTVTVLGNTYVDIISGFEGICTAKATYLTGCDQSCIRPKGLNKDKDGAATSLIPTRRSRSTRQTRCSSTE